MISPKCCPDGSTESALRAALPGVQDSSGGSCVQQQGWGRFGAYGGSLLWPGTAQVTAASPPEWPKQSERTSNRTEEDFVTISSVRMAERSLKWRAVKMPLRST